MKKREIAIISVLVIIIAVALLLLSGNVNGQDRENIPIFESVPDQVVIYQGNLALVNDEMNIYSGKKVQIILPSQAVASTIEIIDGGQKIEKFRLTGSTDPTNQARYGTLKNLLSWESDKTGSRKINLKYMMQGLSWTPRYIMTILNDGQVHFLYRVEIHNNTNASTTANIKLVSGEIGSPSSGSGIYYRQMTNTQFKSSAYDQLSTGGDNSLPSIGATKISAHYLYDLQKAPLEKMGVTFLNLLDKTLSASREYVWVTTTGENVDIVYTVANDTPQPFAQGLVNVYKDRIFLGSDVIEWTPSGSKGHVTVGSAVDIQAEKRVDIEYLMSRQRNKAYKHSVKLIVRNFSNRGETVKIIDQKYPDCVEAAFAEKPASAGNNTYLWTVAIPAKSEKVIDYTFFSDSRYTQPYQSYN